MAEVVQAREVVAWAVVEEAEAVTEAAAQVEAERAAEAMVAEG